MLAFLCVVIHCTIKQVPLNFTGWGSTEFPNWSIVTFVLYNIFTFGFGEEVGWRGFALPILQKRYNALVSSLILTVFWAIWHIPLFLYRPGYVNMDMVGIIGWVLSLLTGSILLTWLYNSARGSILVCAIFHATIDVMFTSKYNSNDIIGIMGALVTIWGICIIVIYKPLNLSRLPRVKFND